MDDEDVFGLRGIAASRIPHTSSTSTLHGASSAVVSWMGDHPVFRYPVFRERCVRGGGRGHPVGGAGFVVSPGVEVKQNQVLLSRGSAQPLGSSGGRHPWLGDCGVRLVAAGPRRPLVRLFVPDGRCPEGRCPSRGVDATDPWTVRKGFLLERVFWPPGAEFAAEWRCSGARESRGAGRAPGVVVDFGEVRAEISTPAERRSRSVGARISLQAHGDFPTRWQRP